MDCTGRRDHSDEQRKSRLKRIEGRCDPARGKVRLKAMEVAMAYIEKVRRRTRKCKEESTIERRGSRDRWRWEFSTNPEHTRDIDPILEIGLGFD